MRVARFHIGLLCFAHNAMNGADHLHPPGTLAKELLASKGSEPVILELAIALFREFPLRGNPALFHKAMEGWVERTVLDLQQIVTGALDVFGDGVAVGRPGKQGPQDEHIEGSLQEVCAVWSGSCHGGRYSTLPF